MLGWGRKQVNEESRIAGQVLTKVVIGNLIMALGIATHSKERPFMGNFRVLDPTPSSTLNTTELYLQLTLSLLHCSKQEGVERRVPCARQHLPPRRLAALARTPVITPAVSPAICNLALPSRKSMITSNL